MEFLESVRANKARDYFTEGYNCAQAVCLAFSDIMGMEESIVAKISSPFGGGMGRMREVCGAVSGMYIVLGYVRGYDDPKDTEGKKALYIEVRELAEQFKTEFGSIICRELLDGVDHTNGPTPEKRTESYYHKRPCGEQVAYCAYILERYLIEKGNM